MAECRPDPLDDGREEGCPNDWRCPHPVLFDHSTKPATAAVGECTLVEMWLPVIVNGKKIGEAWQRRCVCLYGVKCECQEKKKKDDQAGVRGPLKCNELKCPTLWSGQDAPQGTEYRGTCTKVKVPVAGKMVYVCVCIYKPVKKK